RIELAAGPAQGEIAVTVEDRTELEELVRIVRDPERTVLVERVRDEVQHRHREERGPGPAHRRGRPADPRAAQGSSDGPLPPFPLRTRAGKGSTSSLPVLEFRSTSTSVSNTRSRSVHEKARSVGPEASIRPARNR